jgi:twitching motility protein PilU
MAKSTEHGMQTFDQALYKLYSEHEITYDTALAHADSPNDLRLMIKLGADAAEDPMGASDNLTLEEDEQDAFSYRR